MNNFLLSTKAPTIKMLHYRGRLADAYLGIENTLQALSDPKVQAKVYDKMTSGLEEQLRKFIDGANVDEYGGIEKVKSELDELVKTTKESMRKKYTEDYQFVILNQGLVIVCTVFETFLNDTFRTTITEKAEVLISLKNRKETLKNRRMREALENFSPVENKDKITLTQDEIIETFYWLGTMNKLEVFEGIGIDTEKIFDFSKLQYDDKQKYKTWDRDKLQAIVRMRNDIVHRDELRLKTRQELHDIEYFLEILVHNISISFLAKFHILFDIFQFTLEKGIFNSIQELRDFLRDRQKKGNN